MYYTLKAVAAIGIAVLLSGPVTGQGVVMQRNLSLAMAKTIAEGTIAECKSKGYNTAAAVVDRAGQVMVILRDEQATAQNPLTHGNPRKNPLHQVCRRVGHSPSSTTRTPSAFLARERQNAIVTARIAMQA